MLLSQDYIISVLLAVDVVITKGPAARGHARVCACLQRSTMVTLESLLVSVLRTLALHTVTLT